MKKVLFILAVLCTALWSCSSLDLSDVGYGDGDRLKSSAVKEVLYAADSCWKADYQGHEFYFKFHKNGTVTLDSDFLEQEVVGNTTFATKGVTVELTMDQCDVHLQNLGDEFVDTKFIISEIPAEGGVQKLFLSGEASGNVIELQPTTKVYIEGQVASKADFTDLFAKNLLDNQVICDASGKLIAYYGLILNGMGDLSIKVLTIENKSGNDTNGHTQYYESKLTKEGKVFKLDTPVEGIKATNGTTYSFRAINCSGAAITIEGMSGVNLTSNKGAVNDFDYVTSGRKYVMAKAQSHGNACDEIWEETDGTVTSSGASIADVNVMNYDWGADPKQRPLVIWTWWFWNLAFPSSEVGASIMMNNQDKERILFKNISGTGKTCGNGVFSSSEIAEINAHCTNLLSTWFNEKGLFVVRQEIRGNSYIYLLCPDMEATSQGGMWMKFVKG
nr:hypothetical protein [uncultured Bacteroides sp.]